MRGRAAQPRGKRFTLQRVCAHERTTNRLGTEHAEPRAEVRCMRWFGFATLLLLTLLLPRSAAAGRLQDVEDTASAHVVDDDDDDDDREDDDDSASDSSTSGDGSALGRVLMHIVLAPWTLPHALADDPCFAGFALHPYADGPGLMRPRAGPKCVPGASDSPLPEEQAAAEPGRAFAAYADLEGGYVRGNIVSGSIGARLSLPLRIEVEGRMTMWQDLEARPREQALGGTLLAGFRFAQARNVTFRTGAGVRLFSLHETLAGFDLLYGIDVFGEHPVMFHLDLHGGSLGGALTGEVRATLGVQLWKLELYAGYDHTAFANKGRVTRLGGPVIGLRAWF
jgi:hypothetical protein